MAELGYASLGINTEDGEMVDCFGRAAEASSDHERQVVILRVETDDRVIGVVMRRGEFNKLVASPNTGEQIEVALSEEPTEQLTEAA